MQALRTLGTGTVTLDSLAAIEPRPGEVLVDFLAGTVNPVDLLVTDGLFHQIGGIKHRDPVGLGWDIVGRVIALGEGVDNLVPGMLVAGVRTGTDTPCGTLAEQAVLPATDVAPVPAALEPVEAASLGMNALTAAQALDLAGPANDRSLLITGAAGAVGGFALELATAAGWKVTGLARAHDADFVESRKARLVTELPPGGPTYDVVLDAAPLQFDAATFAEVLVPAIADGGTFVGVLGALPAPELPGRKTAVVNVRADGPRLGTLLELAVAGRLTPRVAATVPLRAAERAFAGLRGSGTRGRWVVVAE